MGMITPDMIGELQQKIAANQAPPVQQVDPAAVQAYQGLLSQAQDGPSPVAIEGALRSPYVDGGAKQNAIDTLQARQQLASMNGLQGKGMDKFILSIMDKSLENPSLAEQMDQARVQGGLERIKSGKWNPQTQEEFVKGVTEPSSAGSNLTDATKTELQKQAITLTNHAQQLDNIAGILQANPALADKMHSPQWFVSAREHFGTLSDADKQLVQQHAIFTQALDSYFNDAAKEEGGASALSPAQIKEFKKSIANGSMSPSQLIAVVQASQIDAGRRLALTNHFLDKGIIPGAKQYTAAQAAAEAQLSTAHPMASKAVIQELATQAQKPMDPELAQARLEAAQRSYNDMLKSQRMK